MCAPEYGVENPTASGLDIGLGVQDLWCRPPYMVLCGDSGKCFISNIGRRICQNFCPLSFSHPVFLKVALAPRLFFAITGRSSATSVSLGLQ